MPTYDYVCESCGHNFEEFQSITAEPLTDCPKCVGKVKRLISSGNGFLFKGSGFYITDYRSDSYKKDKSKAEGSSSSKTKSKTTTKSKAKKKTKPVA
jgi:putative FmdB family regulatory protein